MKKVVCNSVVIQGEKLIFTIKSLKQTVISDIYS